MDIENPKLQQKVVDVQEALEKELQNMEPVDTIFCALGTTRAAAGSAEAFRKVDLDYVRIAANAANARHFALVSAQGANPSIPANDWSIFHGLLYSKVKGQAEEAVKAAGFESVTIARPGMLDRGEKARPLERRLAHVLSSVHAATVAKALISSAEDKNFRGARILSMKDIKAFGS